jgi:hypothetical protein
MQSRLTRYGTVSKLFSTPPKFVLVLEELVVEAEDVDVPVPVPVPVPVVIDVVDVVIVVIS